MNITRPVAVLTSDAALALVGHAIAEGARRGVAVSAAVVDPALGVIATIRTDHATTHSADTSLAKARAAASTGRPTGWMNGELAAGIAAATQGRLSNILGGLPVVVDDVCVGALGIAGGTPEQDAEIAAAAVARLG